MGQRRTRQVETILKWAMATVVVAVIAGLAGPHLGAWYHLRAGRTAIDRYHAQEARQHLKVCLQVWPHFIGAHRLAARAAWRDGAFAEAQDHIRECEQLEGVPSEETVFERCLAWAAAGKPDEVEAYLRGRAERDPALAALVREALALGWTRLYRIADAQAILEEWLAQEPDNVQALFLRGEIQRKLGSVEKGKNDYQRVVQLDAARDDARRWLVSALLSTGHYADAQAHAQELLRRDKGDAELRVELACALSEDGKWEEARTVLAAVLDANPEDGRALREQGRTSLREGDPAQAEQWLRNAVRVTPQDFAANWDLAEALSAQGRWADAEEQRQRARQIQDRIERVEEISQRQVPQRPNDAALRCELGTLLITLDRREQGERWLRSALDLDPNYQPARRALARLNAGHGEIDKATQGAQP